MTDLSVSGLCKSFAVEHRSSVVALDDVTFEVTEGEMFTLLGPSGCGKTTTLRALAGLERPDAGEIRFSDKTVFSSSAGIFVAASRRNVGMVFQSYAVWPHMSVFENVAFPLQVAGRGRRYTRQQMRDKVMQALHIVDMDALAERKATALSGGQQQRLALARALVAEPDILLLDEPLSNLDAKLRSKMCLELKRLSEEIGITTVYVTHDQTEALAVSHRVAVMDHGRIVQSGSARDIYERPKNPFIAEFIGTTNFIPARVVEAPGANAHCLVETAFGRVVAATAEPVRAEERVSLSVRPEDVQVSAAPPSEPNAWEAVVETQTFLGYYQDLELRLAGGLLLARAHPSLDVAVGMPVHVKVEPDRCVICR